MLWQTGSLCLSWFLLSNKRVAAATQSFEERVQEIVAEICLGVQIAQAAETLMELCHFLHKIISQKRAGAPPDREGKAPSTLMAQELNGVSVTPSPRKRGCCNLQLQILCFPLIPLQFLLSKSCLKPGCWLLPQLLILHQAKVFQSNHNSWFN